MRIAIVFSVLISLSLSAQINDKRIIPILNQFREVHHDGSYRSEYQTANGISAQETGYLKNAGNKDTETEEVQGGFEYVAPDGTPIQISYIANEYGFQPQGAHLPVAPTPPPIPLEILKSLEYNAAHPEEDDEGDRPSDRRYEKPSTERLFERKFLPPRRF